jgi:hypothetical protein
MELVFIKRIILEQEKEELRAFLIKNSEIVDNIYKI